jgi:hypothetical protein
MITLHRPMADDMTAVEQAEYGDYLALFRNLQVAGLLPEADLPYAPEYYVAVTRHPQRSQEAWHWSGGIN